MRKLVDLRTLNDADHIETLASEGEDYRRWYDLAQAQTIAAATILDCTPGRFADILALLSPRVTVKRNIRYAVQYLRGDGFARDVIRSVRVAVNHYENTGDIRGPKCRAFSRAIQGDLSAVVLDTWMGAAFNVESKKFESAYVRDHCIGIIREVAGRLNWHPAEVQAAVWAATVRSAGRSVPELMILPELDNIPI